MKTWPKRFGSLPLPSSHSSNVFTILRIMFPISIWKWLSPHIKYWKAASFEGFDIVVYTRREKKTLNSRALHALYIFYPGLTSADDQKLECFRSRAINIFINSMKI